VWYLLQLLVKPIMQPRPHFHPSCCSPAPAHYIHRITTVATLPPVTVQPCHCLSCCHHATRRACSVLLSVLPQGCAAVCCCLHCHSVCCWVAAGRATCFAVVLLSGGWVPCSGVGAAHVAAVSLSGGWVSCSGVLLRVLPWCCCQAAACCAVCAAARVTVVSPLSLASRVESHDLVVWLRTGVSSGNRPTKVLKSRKYRAHH